MKRKLLLAALAVPAVVGATVVGSVVAMPSAAAQPELSGKTVEYSVLAADGVDVRVVEKAVRAAGGTVTRSNAAAGLLTATAPENGFTSRLASVRDVLYTSRTVAIGHAPN
ncbi:MAG: serine protease, partial [Pseudonocardiaceae bacterium]|nr:serine protease [Pseudonocardiaceae bacterium]